MEFQIFLQQTMILMTMNIINIGAEQLATSCVVAFSADSSASLAYFAR